MRKCKLTQSELKDVLKYDPDTGLFTWIKGRLKNKLAGSKHVTKNYIIISIRNDAYYAHRLAWLYMSGGWPKNLIDHKDTNGLNNKWINLREASNAQNLRNMKPRNKSGLKGIQKSKHGYSVRMQLGTYKTKKEAIDVYNKASLLYFGEFAYIQQAQDEAATA